MHVRTDAVRTKFAQFVMYRRQLELYVTAQHDGSFKKWLADFERRHGPLAPEVAERVREDRLNPDKFTVTPKEYSKVLLRRVSTGAA